VTKSLDKKTLSLLLDASVDGIVAFDRECRYTAWNQAMERISGLRRAEILGKDAFEVFPFLQQIGEDRFFQEALAGKTVTSKARPYLFPNTSRKGYFEGHYFPLEAGGKVVGGIGIIHDITEQKLATDAARNAHQQLNFHVENSPLAVIEWDSDFRVSRWSAAAERLFGWSAEEVLGKRVSDWKFVFADDVSAVEMVSERQRAGKELQGILNNRNYTKSGEVLHCEWYNSVLKDEDGNLVSVLSLVLDVTARKIAEEERSVSLARERAARKHAEEADRLKDEFLATLSHELRTPLTAILGWASLMRNGEVPATEFSGALEIIERNARAQARLIDDLLDVSRIITGNLHVELRAMNLMSVIEVAAAALRPAAQAKGINLEVAIPPHAQIVRGDPNRIRQVVWNLLLNAIKFTPRDGTVRVRVENSTPHARIIVEDTGEGISSEFLPYVFDRFRQAEGSISRRQGGLGLGLAVVRHLVELHGGAVHASSDGVGRGSLFVVDLPLATERELDAGKLALDDDNLTSARTRLSGLQVLVVEDDEDARVLVSMMLTRQGANVVSAASADEALQAFQLNPPHVLISDIGMPNTDGYELIRRIRKLGSGAKPPVAIALTGYATAKDRERTIEAGYQVHLAKPVEPLELVSAIERLTGRSD
jgi:PAS domain S-box-containing protein